MRFCAHTHSGIRSGVLLGEAALLNTDTMTWSALSVDQGERPSPRRSHAAAAVPGRVGTLLSANHALMRVSCSTACVACNAHSYFLPGQPQ